MPLPTPPFPTPPAALFTAAEVRAVLDAAFVKLEATTPGAWAQWGEKFANSVIDNSPAPEYIAQALNQLLGQKMVAVAKGTAP